MNTTSPRLATLAAAATAALLLSFTPAPAQQYQWTDSPDEQYCELTIDGRPLVRYMYAALDDSSPEARAKTYKPYLHVYSPDGERLLTKGPGGLYPHHRGIFFGFNKVTYGDGRQCDTWHCTGGAYQEHQQFEKLTQSERGGGMISIIHWHGEDGEHFATEQRTHTVGHVNGVTGIDFQSTLSCANGVEKIHLDGDPQHAGVQFRATQHVPDETASQTYYVRTDGVGEPGETRNWNHRDADDPLNDECTNRPWLAMSFVVDGERYTVLYIDHPDNPKPSRWSERDYGRFGSFFVTDVTPDEPLNVKYRYFVKQGEMTVDECQSLCDEFVGDE